MLREGWEKQSLSFLKQSYFFKETHLSFHKITFLLLCQSFPIKAFQALHWSDFIEAGVGSDHSSFAVVQMLEESEAAWISVSLFCTFICLHVTHLYGCVCVFVCVCDDDDDEDETETWRHMSSLAVKCVCVTSFCLPLVPISPSSPVNDTW